MNGKDWQVPISAQRSGRTLRVAHYFEKTNDTDRQVESLCGMRFTPGFASPTTGMKISHCIPCSHRLKKVGAK